MSDDLQATPTAVEKYFFTPLYYPRGVLDVVWWWERRRLVYNACVGSAGMLTLGTMMFVHPMGPGVVFDANTLTVVFAYALAANVCYTSGWMVDLLLRRVLGIRAPDLAPSLLRYGFVFSLGLTLLPIPVMVAVRFAMAILGLKP
jgi:hypothetical protein